MNRIYALLLGLMGVSLCMADISGIVTDTGTTPISGAVVHLEKGGQTATTGPDGHFTLSLNTTNLSGKSESLPNGLSAMIFGTMLNVTVPERVVVEMAVFDLTGKVLSTERKTLDAGSHSINLPYHGAGIYLYKLKSGNSEFVLKSNSVGGVSSGSAVFTQGSSLKPLAKQAIRTASINDVISVTKEGYLNYQVIANNSDTTGIKIKMIVSAGSVTDADGNVYQTVKIGNQVWTVENLRTTKYNDGTAIPLVTDNTAWAALTTPGFCYYNNTIDVNSIKKFGALYNWYVVSPTNLKKLAPAGWHVPTNAEWDTLQNSLIANGYNWDGTTTGIKIAKSVAAKTDWPATTVIGKIGNDLSKNNNSGFSALPGGYRSSVESFVSRSSTCDLWTATECGASLVYSRVLVDYDEGLVLFSNGKSWGRSVRLLRD